jgi:hypothetical protein
MVLNDKQKFPKDYYCDVCVYLIQGQTLADAMALLSLPPKLLLGWNNQFSETGEISYICLSQNF